MAYAILISPEEAIKLAEAENLNLCQIYFMNTIAIQRKLQITLTPEEREELRDKGYIYDGEQKRLREKGRLLFHTDNTRAWFEEFYNAFPNKTPSGRRLRTDKLNSTNARTAWGIFKQKIYTESDFRSLMNGLKNEIREREASGSMEFINNILAWLRQGGWEMYESGNDEEVIYDIQ